MTHDNDHKLDSLETCLGKLLAILVVLAVILAVFGALGEPLMHALP